MFARSDLDRYRRWPLAWIFGPLILGGLIVVAVSVVLRAPLGFPNDQLAGDIRAAGANSGDATYLRQMTDERWDRVCIFPTGVSKQDVDDVLGFGWSKAGGYEDDSRLLLVFVKGDEVVTHTYVETGLVAPPEGDGECRGPQDEATRINFGPWLP